MPGRGKRRLAILLALLGAFLGLGFALAGGASAHATVVASDPADGSRLAHAPSVVTITFDESVGLGGASYLHVTDQSGNRVDSGTAFHPNGDSTKVADRLKPGLGDGTYTASYRVVSADSHPVAGTIRFVVGNGVLAEAGVAHSSTVNPTTSVVFDVARWTSFTGFALLGGAWLLLTVWPQGRDDRRGRAVVWTGWGLTALGALAELLLQGPYAAGTGLSDVANWSLLDATLHTSFGQYLSGRLVLLGAVALLLGRALQADRWRSRVEDAAWPLAVAVALTFSSVGHPDTTNPRWLSVTLDTLHLLAMAAWVGGMVVLAAAVLPRREPDEIRAVLPVFSRVAFTSVAVLAVTGSYAAWRGIGTVHAIFTTTYGLLVVGKVVLFLGLLALGNVSRRAIQHEWRRVPVAYAMSDTALDEQADEEADDGDALGVIDAERLRRSVLVEIVLAVCILVLTAVLVAEPRGKEAIATKELRPAVGVGRSRRRAQRQRHRHARPARHRRRRRIAQRHGREEDHRDCDAAARAARPDPDPPRRERERSHTASNVNLPAAGDWVISLVVTTSEFDADHQRKSRSTSTDPKGNSLMTRLRTVAVAGTAAAVALLVLAAPAFAHVTVSAPGATRGGSDQEITFRVPVEKAVNTVGLKVALPTDTPIAGVEVQAMPGWTHTEKSTKLATPIHTDDGDITEAVSEIDWTAQQGQGLKPGEFGAFTILAGQLPDAPTLTFKAIQTYADGSSVAWIETAAPGSSAAPEHPAPVLTLAAGDSTGHPGTATATATAKPAAAKAEQHRPGGAVDRRARPGRRGAGSRCRDAGAGESVLMRIPWPAVLGGTLVAAVGAVGLIRGAVPVATAGSNAGSPAIVVTNAYVREPAPPTDAAAAYFTVYNTTAQDDTLRSVTSGAGATSVLHTYVNGTMTAAAQGRGDPRARQSRTVDGQGARDDRAAVRHAAARSDRQPGTGLREGRPDRRQCPGDRARGARAGQFVGRAVGATVSRLIRDDPTIPPRRAGCVPRLRDGAERLLQLAPEPVAQRPAVAAQRPAAGRTRVPRRRARPAAAAAVVHAHRHHGQDVRVRHADRGPPDAGVLRLHELPGRLPDDDGRHPPGAAQRCPRPCSARPTSCSSRPTSSTTPPR